MRASFSTSHHHTTSHVTWVCGKNQFHICLFQASFDKKSKVLQCRMGGIFSFPNPFQGFQTNTILVPSFFCRFCPVVAIESFYFRLESLCTRLTRTCSSNWERFYLFPRRRRDLDLNIFTSTKSVSSERCENEERDYVNVDHSESDESASEWPFDLSNQFHICLFQASFDKKSKALLQCRMGGIFSFPNPFQGFQTQSNTILVPSFFCRFCPVVASRASTSSSKVNVRDSRERVPRIEKGFIYFHEDGEISDLEHFYEHQVGKQRRTMWKRRAWLCECRSQWIRWICFGVIF
jgi:hypothetical protein